MVEKAESTDRVEPFVPKVERATRVHDLEGDVRSANVCGSPLRNGDADVGDVDAHDLSDRRRYYELESAVATAEAENAAVRPDPGSFQGLSDNPLTQALQQSRVADGARRRSIERIVERPLQFHPVRHARGAQLPARRRPSRER